MRSQADEDSGPRVLVPSGSGRISENAASVLNAQSRVPAHRQGNMSVSLDELEAAEVCFDTVLIMCVCTL